MKHETIEIIFTILATAADGETTEVGLMRRCDLDSRALKKYVAIMVATGLILLENGRGEQDAYQITEKGWELLRRFQELNELIA